MFNFIKKNKNIDTDKTSLFSKTASLLIHAAKMDENYTEKEKIIIKKTLIDLGVNSEEIDKITKKCVGLYKTCIYKQE